MLQLTGIYTDIQRRGLYIGQRQLRLDFFLSNITNAAGGEPDILPKEYTPDELLLAVKEEVRHKPALITLGGGEPLLQVADLLPVLAAVSAQNSAPLLCLETNATMPDRLAEVKPYISFYALEYLPDYHREFLDSLLAVRDEEVYVRLAVDKNTAPQSVEQLAKTIGNVRPELPLILEPVFGCKNYLSWQALALRHLKDVRVIPRMHL